MANDFLPYQNPATTDAKLDTESLDVGGETVHRERVQIAGKADTEITEVKNGNPSANAHGAVVRNIPHVFTEINDGRKAVATPGTAEQLVAESTVCKKVLIQAEFDNTDIIVVGGSTVVAAAATRQGMALLPGGVIEMNVSDLSLIYLDVMVGGEGVTFIYYN